MDKIKNRGFGALSGEKKAMLLIDRKITPDASIFKTHNGFVVIYFDIDGKQTTEKVDDGNGLISVLKKAFPSKSE